jgi:hypothetical protein
MRWKIQCRANGHPERGCLDVARWSFANADVFHLRLAALPPYPRISPVHIEYSEHIVGNGERLLHNFCDAGLEGVISKLANAKYVGSRAGIWVKTKCIKRQEFIIVGWTPSDKSRSFRSLILGVHDKGELRYAGKVGTGFNTDVPLSVWASCARRCGSIPATEILFGRSPPDRSEPGPG